MSRPYESFEHFFKKATGHSPHDFQIQLATSKDLPTVWKLPTGSGKTATAVLTWLWRSLFPSPNDKEPLGRRLVYCLPIRVLVEQTHNSLLTWLKNLGLTNEVGVHLLMGGEDCTDWTLHPERRAILVGTQDMLMSRALNRGYASFRAKWPMEFGLLNSDCLWIMDEVQLMGPSLGSSAQLAKFRQKWSQSPNKTIWMSATIESTWVQTVDHPKQPEVFSPSLPVAAKGYLDYLKQRAMGRIFSLSMSPPPPPPPKDMVLWRVVSAQKSLDKCTVSGEIKPIAAEIVHLYLQNATANPGTLTLVVINTVKRARELFDQIQKSFLKDSSAPELLLLHSRFRVQERKTHSEKLISPIPPNGRLVVSTQVVEAGVDISASLLITELAPWPSLVQRLGRLNRRGEFKKSKMVWIDLLESESKPYEADDLILARNQLEAISQNGGEVGIDKLPTCPFSRLKITVGQS